MVKKEIRIVLLEDDSAQAEELMALMATVDHFRCQAHYTRADQALMHLGQDRADLYLVDLGLPGVSGIQFIESARSKRPQCEFIVHSISDSSQDLLAALSVGSAGYLLKGCSCQELIQGIECVAEGGGLIGPRMARRLTRYFQSLGSSEPVLTRAENRVLQQLKTGRTYNEIAEQLVVSPSTVQSHIKRIYAKLNVNSRTEAVHSGMLFGLID